MKTLVGEVVSTKMEKTVVVRIKRTVQDPLYKKVVRLRTQLKAHDEKNDCRSGDKVRLVECRPLSKSKSWRVVEVLARSKSLDTPVAGGKK